MIKIIQVKNKTERFTLFSCQILSGYYVYKFEIIFENSGTKFANIFKIDLVALLKWKEINASSKSNGKSNCRSKKASSHNKSTQ